jgi:hypothetical protein
MKLFSYTDFASRHKNCILCDIVSFENDLFQGDSPRSTFLIPEAQTTPSADPNALVEGPKNIWLQKNHTQEIVRI